MKNFWEAIRLANKATKLRTCVSLQAKGRVILKLVQGSPVLPRRPKAFEGQISFLFGFKR